MILVRQGADPHGLFECCGAGPADFGFVVVRPAATGVLGLCLLPSIEEELVGLAPGQHTALVGVFPVLGDSGTQPCRQVVDGRLRGRRRRCSDGLQQPGQRFAVAVDEFHTDDLRGDDVAHEHLGHTMAEQEGRFALFSSEGGIFTTLGGRYSNGVPNLDLVLKAWSGDHWDSGRVTRGDLTIENPFLSIGLTVQPEILEGLAEVKALRHSGFLGRFFYALPRSLVGIRKPDGTAIPEHVRDAYRDAVWALGHIVWPSPEAELPLTEQAVRLLDDFHEGHEPRLHPDLGDLAEMADWAAKLPGQLVRVATLLALFDQPHVDRIDATWVRQAINLAPYFISQASAAFRLMAGNTSRTARPRIVLTWIRRKHLTEFTVRDVRRGLGGQEWAKDVEEIRAALDELEDLGWVQMLPQPDTGSRAGRKPSERYAVNPAAHRPGSVNSVNESRGAA